MIEKINFKDSSSYLYRILFLLLLLSFLYQKYISDKNNYELHVHNFDNLNINKFRYEDKINIHSQNNLREIASRINLADQDPSTNNSKLNLSETSQGIQNKIHSNKSNSPSIDQKIKLDNSLKEYFLVEIIGKDKLYKTSLLDNSDSSGNNVKETQGQGVLKVSGKSIKDLDVDVTIENITIQINVNNSNLENGYFHYQGDGGLQTLSGIVNAFGTEEYVITLVNGVHNGIKLRFINDEKLLQLKNISSEIPGSNSNDNTNIVKESFLSNEDSEKERNSVSNQNNNSFDHSNTNSNIEIVQAEMIQNEIIEERYQKAIESVTTLENQIPDLPTSSSEPISEEQASENPKIVVSSFKF